MRFEIPFHGHKNVRSLHPKTIEITKDSNLTVSGDCIIGVNATHSCFDIPLQMKKILQNPKSEVTCTILVQDFSFKIKGRGNDKLTLTNPHDIVIRKSNFTCPRTLATNCNFGSDSIPRKIVKSLQNPEVKGIFRIDVS